MRTITKAPHLLCLLCTICFFIAVTTAPCIASTSVNLQVAVDSEKSPKEILPEANVATPSDEEIIAQIDQETDAIAENAEELSGQSEINPEQSITQDVAPSTEEPTKQITTENAESESIQEPGQTPEEVLEEPAQEEAPPSEFLPLLKLISESKKLDIPLLGTFIFALDAAFSPEALAPTAQITAKPEKETIDLKVIQLTKPILSFSLATGLSLNASLSCLGYELGPITITIIFDHHGKFVNLTGTLDAEKAFKPFEKIPGAKNTPGLKDIEIKKLKLTIDAAKNVQFSGQSTILSMAAEVSVLMVSSDDKKSLPLLKAKPLEPLNLTKLLPILDKTPLKDLEFTDAQCIISSQEYFDYESGLRFNAGFSLAGNMKLSGALFENARKLIPILPKEAYTVCTIGDEPQFMLRVAESYHLGGDTSLEQIFLNIQSRTLTPTGPRIEMSLKTNIKTKLPKEKDFTLFTGEVSIPLDPKLPTIVMKGTMQGTWNNVLGIKGITISNVAFELGASIATGFTPTSVGFAGTLDVGDKKVKMATKTSKDGDFVLYGKFDGELGLSDILSLAKATGANIPKEKIPDFSLKNVEVKIAPQSTKIGELVFTKGTTLIGELTIKGCDFLKMDSPKASIDLTIDDLSINGKGSISTLSLANILKITGTGADGKKGTPDDGPTIKLVLTPLEQSFILSGETTLLGAECKVDVDLLPTNAYFNTMLNLAPSLTVKAKGQMIKSGALPDFKFTGEITTPSSLPFDKKDIEAGTQILEENRDKVKKDFQDRLSNLEKKISDRQKAMEANPAYKKLLSSLDETKGKIRSVEQEVNKLESKLSGLDSEIKALERKLGVAFNLDTYPTIDIDAPFNHQPLRLSFNNPQNLYSIEEKIDPAKLDLRTYNAQYPLLCWGWFRRAVRSVSSSVSSAASTVTKPIQKHIVEPAKNIVAKVVQKTGVEGLAEKVGGKDAIEKLKKAGYDVAKIATNPGNWDDAIKLAALKTAREAARVAFEAARAPLNGLRLSLRGLEESIKNFDPEILKLRAEQIALTAEMGAKMAALEAAIVAFKTTTLAAFPAIKWLTPIEIRKLSVSANLRGLASGELPTISCDIKAFHAIEKTITFSADLKNIPSMLKKLVLKLFLLK